MRSGRQNPKKLLATLRNKTLEYQNFARQVEDLNKRTVNSLKYNVKKKNEYKKHMLEPREIIKEVEIEVIKEVPIEVEVIREVEVPVEVIVEKEVIKRVKVPVEIEVIVEKPIEIIREIEVPVKVVKYIDVIKEVQVEVIKEVEKIKEVKVPFETIKEVEVIKEVKVEVPIEVIVEKEVLIPVDKLMITMNKLKDDYDTKLKLEKLSKKALEKRYQVALAQMKLKKVVKVIKPKVSKGWLSTYIYILTMFSLTQILWILI